MMAVSYVALLFLAPLFGALPAGHVVLGFYMMFATTVTGMN